MLRTLRLLWVAVAAFIVGTTTNAWAINPATISLTVTIENLSVSATGPIAFGVVGVGSETVSTSASTVTNDGNGVETFSLSLSNPGGWTAVQAAPGAEEYALLAQFNTIAPSAVAFTYANHALTTTPVSSSVTKFAGDQNGVSVAPAGALSLWFRFNAPTSTAVATQQAITVFVLATAG